MRVEVALGQRQASDGHPGAPAAFVTDAMAPANYVRHKHAFAWRQDNLNEVLVFVALRVRDDGRLWTVVPAATLAEASLAANALRAELERRNTHPLVLQACRAEVLADNTFHALLEALKGVFDRLRDMSGETLDGGDLVAAVLDGGKAGEPMLTINHYSTKSERSEQAGFANVVRGLGGLYRNPVAHDLRTKRSVSDDELLEALTAVSMVHRRLDGATHR